MIVSVRNVKEFMNWINQLTPNKRIYIAGAGDYGKLMGKFLTEQNISWEAYVDKNINLSCVEGKKVYSYGRKFSEKASFLVSSYDYSSEIMDELKNTGVPEDNIFAFPNIQDIMCDMYDFFVHWSEYTKEVQKFHNKYFGQRCFIIGNGPSLRVTDLDKLKNEITFGCNSIYAVYEKTDWRPTFYCAWDYIFCKDRMSEKEDVQRLISECEAFFTSIMCEGFRFRDDEDIDNLFYVRDRVEIDRRTGLSLFSDDCSKQVYAAGSVSYFMLQLAAYMGFREIFLLGMDAFYDLNIYESGANVTELKTNHMDLIEKVERENMKAVISKFGYTKAADIANQQDGYLSAREYADGHGIKIYNATRGGRLELFKRVDFDSLF